MVTSVISKEYLATQQDILDLQDKWVEEIDKETFIQELQGEYRNAEIPLIVQVDMKIDGKKYLSWINELADLLLRRDPEFELTLKKVKEILNEGLANKWIKEVLSFNNIYFKGFAEENKIAEWLPHFLAEHAIRPYLRLLGENYQEELENAEVKGYCPSCGEPVRLAQLEGDGQKVIYCSRCHSHKQEKRLMCSHCGNEDHKTLSYLTVEDNPTEQIFVCKECNGYTKMIDTREATDKPNPTMLDIKTIHLDFAAQQHGYGVEKD